MFNIYFLKIIILAMICLKSFGTCVVIDSHENEDLLTSLISLRKKCPANVLELKKVFKEDGLVANPSMVANRGYHNPKYGSFSIFETLEGVSNTLSLLVKPEHLYFGHFTDKNTLNTIILDQENSDNKLLVELIAYDFRKKVYNFYELIGGFPAPRWIYRGDSNDALSDNRALKIKGVESRPSKMRCSACHNSGGPIMKELDFPHSDWWTRKNLLEFGNARLSQELEIYSKNFLDASIFSKNVKAGINLLNNSEISKALSVKEKLRPLFCTTEINLLSDKEIFVTPIHEQIKISSEIFVNPLLVSPVIMVMKKEMYTTSLVDLNSHFPESGGLDSMYAFLAPVKSYVDISSINKLINENIIDEEFALDVLFIDYKRPLFSKSRCELLSYIENIHGWKTKFLSNLKSSSKKSAIELYNNLQLRNGKEHRIIASKFVSEKGLSWNYQGKITSELSDLNLLRKSVFEDEISKNPRGQILEPGFRVIFPVIEKDIQSLHTK